MSAIAKAWVEFGVDNAGLGAGLRRAEGTAKKSAFRMGKMFGGLGAQLALAFGGTAALFAAKKSVDAFKVQEQAVRKLQAVLKSTGGAAGLTADEIAKFAAERQAVTNFGDEVTIGGAAILATFKEVKGEAFKETMTVAQDMATILGTDLKGTLLQVGKAMNDPVLGATALSRAGVQFTTVQKDQIKGFVETNQLAKAQAIVMKELQSQFGGAAEAAVDPMKQLSNAVGDLGEKIGSFLAPTIDSISTKLVGMGDDATGTAEAWHDAGKVMAAAFENPLEAVEALGISMELSLMDAVPGMEGVFEQFGATLIGLFDGIGAAWESIMNFMKAAGEVFVAGFLSAWQSVSNAVEAGKETLTGSGSKESRARRQRLQNEVDARFATSLKTVAKGTNPISAAMKAFSETRGNALAGFEDEGLKSRLEKRQEEIGATFADAIREMSKEPGPAPQPRIAGTEEEGGASPETRKGAFTGLAEMAKRIQSGLSPAEKIGKQQVDIAKQQTAKLGEAVAALRSIDDHTRMGTAGTFA